MPKDPIDSMQVYMRDVRRFSLLEAEEEKRLACCIAEGQRATAALAEPDVSSHQQCALEELRREGQEARDRIVVANLRLVVRIARRYARRGNYHGLNLLDLVQEGNIGLLKAAERFTSEHGRFSTFAGWWIHQKIGRALANQSRLIRIPVRDHEKLDRLRLEENWSLVAKGREATPEELAAELGIDVGSLVKLRDAEREFLSLAAPLPGDEPEAVYEDLVEDPEGAAFTRRLEERQWLTWVVAGLSERSRRILQGRFGLDLTLEEVGRRESLTRERVRQIEREALEKMRQPSCNWPRKDPGARGPHFHP